MKKIFQILWLPVLIFFFNASPLAKYLYATQPLFDVCMHIIGGFAIGYMLITILKVFKISWWKHIPKLWKVVFIVSFVMLFGFAWEWYEFLSDIFLKTNHQPNLADTMYDILFDFMGALVFCTTQFGLSRNRTQHL